MKNRYPIATLPLLAVCLAALAILLSVSGIAVSGERVFRNVIVLVGDGMGSTHTTLARWYKGAPLSLDAMYVGGMRTYSADSLITGSAPAATALACGFKSMGRSVGIMPCGAAIVPGVFDPGESRCKPIASVLEGAKLSGRSVGLVATSNIQHATPAAFSSHWPDRADYDEIAKQQVHQDIDVVLGGGRRYLLPAGKGGTRKGDEDLIGVLRSKGYRLVANREEMLGAVSPKLWGLFADDALAYDLDRKSLSPGEPGLSEMTAKAIEVLSKNPKGFFLFVEGSKIDWASHANDPVGVISDVLAFDEAVGIALDLARKDGGTMVIAFSDHGNGGMSIGNRVTDKTYSRLRHEQVVGPLRKASLTGEGIEKVLKGDRSEDNVKRVISEYLGIDDLTPEEMAVVRSAKPGRMNGATGPVVSARSGVGWTTQGHTGEDLFFYYYGIDRPLRMTENSDIAHITAKAMGFALADVDRRLFIPADEAFNGVGTSVTLDRRDSRNMVLIVESAGKRAELPLSKNIMKIKGKTETTRTLEGITVLAPQTGKVYIPRQAVDIFKNVQ
ncbi:MAG: alkaline phosphatase [Syntrophorhabdus sp.]|nr:alkaline phosphatase [Syntrophorhabdus sp.]